MTRRLIGTVALIALATGCTKGDRSDSAKPAGTNAPGLASMEKWEHFDYAARVVPAEALAPLSLADLQRIRGIIFGAHGRVFQDSTLQRWLATRPWYHPDTTFTNTRLQPRERENLDLVRAAEARRHTQIEPGDMRFHQNSVITSAMLGEHSPQDWEVLEAEVLANHGYVFEQNGYHEDDYERSLDAQGYFDERYWYQRKPEFTADQLSAIEQQNLDTITVAVTRQLGRVLSPGMMNLFQSTALSEEMLAKVSIADLRLLRNEVYARHGRLFRTPWLAQHFRMEPWYKARTEFSDAELSPVERANIALITAREQRLHESLATDELRVSDVRGLRPDDARRLRNEIFARHGRRFRDSRLQSYFASFAWYKPSDSFREDQLNATERKNADLISQYESGRFTEG
jgi:hypothetical protein